MRRLILASLLFCAAPALAQPPNLDRVEIRVERVAPGVAVLFGAGGNIGLSYGSDGNVLIDDQYAPLSDRILAAVRSIDPDPVRFLINTHYHGDHTGGNEAIGGAGAVIVAHDNVRRRLSTQQLVLGNVVPPSPAGALPVVTFSQSVTFHLNGDELRVFHVDHAHTDGDSIIYWTGANVLHMGDTFFNGMLPFIDIDGGGSIDGVLRALDQALNIATDRTVIIPGHGPIARRSDLVRYRDMLSGLRDRVAAEIRAGRSLEQIKALRLADPHGGPTDFFPPDFFIEQLYRDLTMVRGEMG
ncbi:MBL fold metallo-hydrolase [Allosphingosinicella sp.]|jgi:glyoxylase-like metal-dependent hydrolase (beta-lactamase superfamily II)|uniref:MBL fold metallo-hydrolase n=1 Tax=Allosphingosinicella sp. TaxID=2823234 RepID=UPI002EE1B869